MTDAHKQTERRLLTGFDEIRQAVVQVAACAERSLTILTPDLEPGIYDSEEFLETVKRMVLSRRYSRVRVLIADPAHTVRTGNHLVALGRRLAAFIDIRNLREDYRSSFQDAFIIADESAVLYRSEGRRFDGIMGTFEPVIARQHLDRFEQPWLDSAFRPAERGLEV